MFELSLVRRNSKGEPIGRRFYKCNNGAEMAQRFNENQVIKLPKKKKKTNQVLPSKTEAEKILKNMFNNIKSKEVKEIVDND